MVGCTGIRYLVYRNPVFEYVVCSVGVVTFFPKFLEYAGCFFEYDDVVWGR